MNRFFTVAFGILAVPLLLGCSLRAGTEPPPPDSGYLTHIVAGEGETLSSLSLWYTGDVRLWRDFYVRAASGQISRLHPGDEVLIPRRLAIRPSPVPSRFLERFKFQASRTSSARRNLEQDPESEAEAEERATATRAQDLFLDRLIATPPASTSLPALAPR